MGITYDTDMIGAKGRTYAEKKVDLLKQLGFKVDRHIFDNCKSEYEIDRRARDIIFSK